MKIVNLSEQLKAAQEADEGGGGDFITPVSGQDYKVKVKYVKITEENFFGLPTWWCIMQITEGDDEGESFGMEFPVTTMGFINKRTFENLRAFGVTEDMLSALDIELVGAMLKDSEAVVHVKWGENKKKPQYPYQNHTISPVERNIPAPAPVPAEDDEDLYD